ncbi:MAG: tetratricopeptide repeat protein [bacterium]
MKRLFFTVITSVILLVSAAKFASPMGSRAKGPRYNLLLITIDTLRADHLGCYGYNKVKTPAIDSLAKEGVLFTRAFTPVPVTLPSHVSIMTGQYPIQHGIRNNGNFILGPDATTLAEVMKAQGYRTGACIGAFVLDSLFGLDQGFDFYDDSLPKEGAAAILLENERRAEAVTQAGLNWLEKNKDAPFFLWLHYFDPHAIYLPPNPFKEEYKGNLYDGEIAYTDSCIDNLLQGMEKLELKERTIIILTSDHGEGLGEHGEPTHAIFIYDSTLQIPLIIRDPGGTLPSGKINAMVTTLDIFPTILDLLDLSSKEINLKFEGKSLMPLIIKKVDSLHSEILCESLYPELNFGWSRIEGVRTPEWKYVSAPRPELYNLIEDPKETKNLFPQTTNVWQDKLTALKAALGPEKESAVSLDDQVRQRLESLGYVWTAKEEHSGERPDPKDMIHIMEGIDRGVSYIYLGFYDRARKEFQKILEINPENASALFYLASIEERTGNLEEAERIFKRLLTISPDYLDVHNHLGVIYHKKGDLDMALREFELALEQAEYSEVYYNLSVVSRLKGQQDKAVKAAHMAIELDPNYADAINQLGQLAFDKGAPEEASKYFLRALRIEPKHLEASNNLGVLYHSQGREEEAIKAFRHALSIDPNRGEAYNNLGSIYLSMGLYDQAEEEFKQAIRLKPDYPEGIINLGTVFFHKGDYKNAMVYYLKAIEMVPENQEAWKHLGLLFLAQGEYEKGYNALKGALEKGGKSAELYFNIGQASFGLKRFGEALSYWEKAITLSPDHKNTYLKMGQLLFDQGMTERAVTTWGKAYSLDPKDPLPLMNMATVKFQNEEYPEAISLWEKALEVNPTLEEPYLHIGTAYLRQNEVDKAIQIWETLLKQNPDNLEVLINLGTALYEKKDIDGAIRLWEKAEELDSENPKIHYNLGLAFIYMKDYKGAVNALKEALRLEPYNQEALLLWEQVKTLCPDPCD